MLGLLLLTACNKESKTIIAYPSEMHKTLDDNKKLWEKGNTKNYSFVVKRFCFCPREEKKQITVKNGKVTEAKHIPSNTPLRHGSKAKKIEGYFDIIQDALDRNASKLTVTYDKTYGFPSEIFIDYNKQITDEEIYYTLTHFNPHIDNGGFTCTQQYLPVCARVDIECVTTPCEAIEETFSNMCHLNANPNATYLRDGEC